jgi:Holliday junction resolvase RusA-like endonuclease
VNEVRHFYIPGEPQGKGRPRFTREGRAYTPSKTAAYESIVRACYMAACKSDPFPKDVPLVVTIEAIFGLSKSDSTKKQQAKLCGMVRPTKKADADNIAKIVCDSLNGIAYHDDSQVTTLHVIKRYGAEAGVEVWISMEDT